MVGGGQWLLTRESRASLCKNPLSFWLSVNDMLNEILILK
jgi:hypothetical protein